TVDERMLAAFAVLHEIRITSVAERHRRVVLLDAAAHFGDEPLSQLGRPLERFFRVSIFSLEIGANFGVEDGGIPHDVGPVRGAEPGVIVDHALAMNETLDGLWFCGRESCSR